MKYNNIMSDNECPITQEIIQHPCEVIPCKHIFEFYAIHQWLLDNRTCPVCRTDCDTKENIIEKNKIKFKIEIEKLIEKEKGKRDNIEREYNTDDDRKRFIQDYNLLKKKIQAIELKNIYGDKGVIFDLQFSALGFINSPNILFISYLEDRKEQLNAIIKQLAFQYVFANMDREVIRRINVFYANYDPVEYDEEQTKFINEIFTSLKCEIIKLSYDEIQEAKTNLDLGYCLNYVDRR